MSEVEVNRKAKIQNNKIEIKSNVDEVLSKEEFLEMYGRKSQEVMEIRDAVTQGRAQLQELLKVKSTPEAEKLKERLVLAEKLKKRDELQKNLRDIEKTLQTKEKEMEAFNSVIQELQQAKA